MVVGAASGLLGATAFYILAYLGACGDRAMTAARNMTPAEVDRLMTQAMVMGAAMGAIGGIYVGAGPYAAAAFEIGMGAIGMTVSGLDIATNGLNWCNGIAFAMSVAAVVHGAYRWHNLRAASHAGQTAQEQKPCAGDCDGDGALPLQEPADLAQRLWDRYGDKPGAEWVLREFAGGGTKGQGADWVIRFSLQNLDPSTVVGFEMAGTRGRVDIVLETGVRITLLEAKSLNWFKYRGIENRVAGDIIHEVLYHGEGQDVRSLLVVEAAGAYLPQWFLEALELFGIEVRVFAQ